MAAGAVSLSSLLAAPLIAGDAIILHGDCLELMREMGDDSVDLVITSPPYEAARTYGIGFSLRGDAWVQWAAERYMECVRVCRGAVCWVVEGQTRNYEYSAAPFLLMAELHRRGVKLRKPPIFKRVGIPGQGGPDWFRNDYELVICSAKGRLPWSDNTAMGHPPKYPPGGKPSHRTVSGERVGLREGGLPRGVSGKRRKRGYTVPKLSNPGNVIACHVGGGHMGSKLAHENEAPFPEKLAEFFVRSLCPPGGTVLDPFGGSGTVAAVCVKTGRRSISIDVRESQIDIMKRRVDEARSLCQAAGGGA